MEVILPHTVYMFTILKYRESKKYIPSFRSEQEFFVSWEICEQKVGLLNKLLLLWCCVTCTHTELPQGPVHLSSCLSFWVDVQGLGIDDLHLDFGNQVWEGTRTRIGKAWREKDVW